MMRMASQKVLFSKDKRNGSFPSRIFVFFVFFVVHFLRYRAAVR